MIRGRILKFSEEEPGMHLEHDPDNAPLVLDGGCGNISAAYDVQSAKLTRLKCDGQRPFLNNINPNISLNNIDLNDNGVKVRP